MRKSRSKKRLGNVVMGEARKEENVCRWRGIRFLLVSEWSKMVLISEAFEFWGDKTLYRQHIRVLHLVKV